jgi:hypothetical protein
MLIPSLQETNFLSAFAIRDPDFTQLLAYEPPQYPTSSNDYPRNATPMAPSEQIIALDGSELRELHTVAPEISSQLQPRTRR